MELYRIGKIVSVGQKYIILETQFVGQLVYVLNSQNYQINKIQKVYTYTYKTGYFSILYGFNTFKERKFFENLLMIRGINPQIAINILQNGIDNLINWIKTNKMQEFLKISLISERCAHQIILMLKNLISPSINNQIMDHTFPTTSSPTSSATSMHSMQFAEIVPKAIKNFQDYHKIREPLKILGFNNKQIEYAIKNLSPRDSIEAMIEDAIKIIADVKFS